MKPTRLVDTLLSLIEKVNIAPSLQNSLLQCH